jgi:hypothetical protein
MDGRYAEKVVEVFQDSSSKDLQQSDGWAWLYFIDGSASRRLQDQDDCKSDNTCE